MSKEPTVRTAFSVPMKGVAIVAAAAALIAGEAIAQAQQKDVVNGAAVPSVTETKAIAEEGFIYGLPLVMNYAVMYEYAVDKKSASSRLLSIRSITCTASRPIRTRRSLRRTATHHTR